METRSFFHDPDISLPVIRRRAGEALLDLIAWYGLIILTSGKPFGRSGFPSRQAYYNALRRLREAGLIAYKRKPDNEQVLILTREGDARLSDAFKPERFWNKKWNRFWYVLVYDVPEENRQYRDSLRGFLERLRMGCLQRSVWVSARDVRPQYDDLVKAAGAEWISFLFEATTVLGRRSHDIVRDAWDWDRIADVHLWYLSVYEHNLSAIRSGKIEGDLLYTLAREELSAYQSAMFEDPLLPRELIPHGYRGFEVLELHKSFVKEARKRLPRRKRKRE